MRAGCPRPPKKDHLPTKFNLETLKSRLARRLGLAFLMVLAAGLAAACGGSGGGSGSGQLNIAYQPGIGYAQILIMKEEGWLQEELPEYEVSYQQLNSGSAIRDGMITGDIQVGSGGVGPFLIGYDSGVGWKLLSGLNQMELWLMAQGDEYQNLEDFAENDGRIATPAADSIQAVVLRRGAQEELGDAEALDSNLVSQGHPEAQQALISGQLAGHLTSPPFQFTERDEGANIILRSYDLFGEHTFNSVFVQEDYYGDNQEAMQTLYDNVQRATELIEDDPGRAAEILSEESDGGDSPENFERYITEENVSYNTEPRGFIEFAEFMQEIDLLDAVPESCTDLVLETLGEPQEC